MTEEAVTQAIGPVDIFGRVMKPACSCQFARRNRRWVQIAWCREHMLEAKK